MKIGDLLGFAGIQWDLMGFDLMGKSTIIWVLLRITPW